MSFEKRLKTIKQILIMLRYSLEDQSVIMCSSVLCMVFVCIVLKYNYFVLRALCAINKVIKERGPDIEVTRGQF